MCSKIRFARIYSIDQVSHWTNPRYIKKRFFVYKIAIFKMFCEKIDIDFKRNAFHIATQLAN